MKKHFLYIVLCLSCLLTTATATTLDTFLQTLADNTLHADFVITISEGASQPMNYPGTITMRGDRFMLEMFDMEAAYDGKTLYVYSATTDELTLSTPTEQELMEANPFLYAQALSEVCTITEQPIVVQAGAHLTITLTTTDDLTLSTPTEQELMEANPFLYTHALSKVCTITEQTTAPQALTIILTPNDQSVGIQRFTLRIEKETMLPSSIEIKEGKQLTTLRLTNPTYTTDIPSFTIIKPDAFLNDLR